MPPIAQPDISADLQIPCEKKKVFAGTTYDDLSVAFVARGHQLDNCGKKYDDLLAEIKRLMYGTAK